VVLRLGGAATVKNRLLPFFVGFFLAAVLSVVIWDIYAWQLQSMGIERLYSGMP
jgi:predicted PurR-regulated permease PerM